MFRTLCGSIALNYPPASLCAGGACASLLHVMEDAYLSLGVTRCLGVTGLMCFGHLLPKALSFSLCILQPFEFCLRRVELGELAPCLRGGAPLALLIVQAGPRVHV